MIKIYTINTILNLLYLFYYERQSVLVLLISLTLQFFVFSELKKIFKGQLFLIVTSLLILSIPTSFVNIFGGNYGNLPISWYNLYFVLILFLSLLHKVRFEHFSFKSSLLSFFWLIIALLNSYDFNSALRDFINFLPFLFFCSIYMNLEDDSHFASHTLVKLYINSALSLVIPIIVQIIAFTKGIFLGKIDIMPARVGFGTIFSDYSFLSLFLSSAAMIAWIMKYRVITIFLLIGSVLTTARTGIFAFIITLMFLGTFDYVKKMKGLQLIKIISFVFVLSALALFTLRQFRQEDILNPSLRDILLKNALSLFIQNPIFGFGIGTEDFKSKFGFAIPHNFIVQSLVQLGLVGSILLILIFVNLWRRSWKNRKIIKPLNAAFYGFVVTFLGSMFIPDIINSRFLPILVFLLRMPNWRRKNNATTYNYLL